MKIKVEDLDDEQLAATAYVWHRRAEAGEPNATETWFELEKELKVRLGSTPSSHSPFESANRKQRPWWKFW